MRKSQAQTFNEIAQAAYKAFPEELENLVLCTTSSEMPVFIAPAVAEKLSKDTEAVKKAVRERIAELNQIGAEGVAQRHYPLAGTEVGIIAMWESRDRHWAIFTLDHELGHFILKNGSKTTGIPPQKAESAADAFAMLRHIQRFGLNTYIVDSFAQDRGYCIILVRDTAHYTSRAVQKAISHAKEKDISSLSLQDTAKLAEEIADECALEKKTLNKISKAFARAREHLDKEMGTRSAVINKLANEDRKAMRSICRETLTVMKKHWRDPDIFEAGNLFLRHHFLMDFMQEAAKTDPYWKNALTFIDNPEALVRRKFLWRKPYF